MSMRLSVAGLFAAGLLSAMCALPAAAQDYYATTSHARHGNGYSPSSIVAGWEGEASFSVVAITPDGKRVSGAAPATTEWKATVTTGPRKEADDDNEEDERYLDKQATNPAKQAAHAGPPVPRREAVYSSLTCPAVLARMQALKPLTTFEFDPPAFNGNSDGSKGDGREGFDLWLRVGNAELNKSAETPSSALGGWYRETEKALAACPAMPAPNLTGITSPKRN